MAETVAEIVAAHRAGTSTPADTVARCYERIRAHGDDAVFIALRPENEVLAEARALAAEGQSGRPLYGVPVAVKDNIDVRGLPTTAGCPAYAYRPKRDATAVERLKAAGAIVIGKTNLDQFATGLVGVRTPYGIPRNPHNPKLIPGGSSSGSAVAVAAGLVPLALGTDTAGSGRVPAGLNNIVGLKPSLGLVSNAGVVPACRSLDCVSIFALTADDAWAALCAIAGPDAADPCTKAFALGAPGPLAPGTRIAVPRPADRKFFGDRRAKAAFDAACDLAARLGYAVIEIDLRPFLETARLLYDGPWVAERYAAVGDFIARHPKQAHPVTRKIILGGKRATAVDAFQAFYRLAELRGAAHRQLACVDALMVPTAPAAYTVDQVSRDPIGLNSRLGTYTNFVNLLELAGLAIPATIAQDGTPFGVTFLAPAGRDALLVSIGREFHAATGLTLGALGVAQPRLPPLTAAPRSDEIAIAVVGAHLSGMPLNGELIKLGARFLKTTLTAPGYRLFALADARPQKPGLLRVADNDGVAIEVELWALPVAAFGKFVATIPPPLSIGTVTLADGETVKGFLVEAAAVAQATDISSFGGWRAFVARQKLRA
ncbi:MAG TPA: allophanate hydrolase [Xanthobacteraceae bacterium]|nr:allophanate hydrolase [Xanthobacteraceae bacterium]